MTEFDSTQNIVNSHSLETVENGAPKTKQKHKKFVNLLIKLAVLLILKAHFIWATIYFVTNSDDTLDSTTCTGYGFWMIIYIFIYFIIFYNVLLKPYIIPFISNLTSKYLSPQLKKIPFWPLVSRGVILAAILAFIVYDCRDDFSRLMPLTGLVIFFIIGFLFSSAKKQIPWPTVISGLIAQFILGLLMIRWDTGRNIFSCVGDRVDTFLNYAVNASAFVYSEELVLKQAIFAFNALAAIYLMNFCINILYYYGIMQAIVVDLGKILQFVLGTPICESVNSAANIFLGMSESPFLLKPFLDHLTDSEIHSIMTSGFASVSGTVLAAYISFGANPAHLVTSCVMSAPAALCYSKLMYPETEEVVVTHENVKTIKMKFGSVLDAAIKGANEASQVVIGIIANLISFIAFVYFINGVLGWLGTLVGFVAEDEIWSLELILGKILIPLSYTMGVKWDDCEKVGQLIGMKTILNEFIAFQKMQHMELSSKSRIIATYSICGFANPGSIGTMLSTLTIFMPRKKHSVTKLVFRAFIGGSFACFMTACIAGLLTV
ncbi:sodium/nucleoside cotransporter 2-like [Tribolium madens]|uniref:sodium/nucleoside cotransporter 2-like n=1 Tax=Tribolium madens TaxID=41895 RepID=UPI001CF755F9|nr:sodium/nucleoside cotransporter 2-like [Tribolium madens]